METSDRIQLSEEQRRVVEAERPKLVVRAAAGSGKTRVLVERFLRFVLQEGLDADRILTITFTKRAAAEMKSRIVRRLTEVGRTDQAQLAETGPISTIHGFCERLLRENAAAAGIDPDFEVQEGFERRRLLTALAQAATTEALDQDDALARVLERVLAQKPHRTEREAVEEIVGWVRETFDALRGTGVDPGTLAEGSADHEAWLGAFWRSRRPESEGRPSYDTLFELLRKTPGCKLSARSAEQAAEEDRLAAESSCALGRLVSEVWLRYEQEMRQRGWLDFSALEAGALRLLERSAAVRDRCRSTYPVVLVDEAQDLNPVQYRLLELLSCDQEMLVGDEQQSIYGFRQADKTLFERHAGLHDALPLTRNYRSHESILRFVDDLFGEEWADRGRMGPDRPSVDRPYEAVEVLQTKSSGGEAIVQRVLELAAQGCRLGDIAILTRRRGQAADLHRALRQAGVQSRLFGESEDYYTRLEIRDMANALQALVDPSDRLPFLSFLRGPLVGLSMDSIAQIALDGLPEDWSSWRPPVPEDEEAWRRFLGWYPELARFADRLSAWEALKELFARSGCLERFAELHGPWQTLMNVRKLLRLAADAPELGPREFALQIREIERMRHAEGEAPVSDEDDDEVKVMTIHKAKGLEFPVVLVAGLDGRPRKPGPLVVDRRAGLAVLALGMHRAPCWVTTVGAIQERDREEELRVLYVALTRAKDRLIVCGPAGIPSGPSPWAWMCRKRAFQTLLGRGPRRR